MSVAMTKAEGVTVLTLTTDPQSSSPPLCQILKGLCCSVSQDLKEIQGTSQSVLGTLQIMIGLMNIGLAGILCSAYYGFWWLMGDSMFPFWAGGIFIFFGVMNILSEKRPSQCLVILNVVLSILGVVLGFLALSLYCINNGDIRFWWICREGDSFPPFITPPPSAEEMMIRQKCSEAQKLAEILLKGINFTLVTLSVLEICVTISSAVLGIKALIYSNKRENKSPDDFEHCKPQLEEVTSKPEA